MHRFELIAVQAIAFATSLLPWRGAAGAAVMAAGIVARR